MFNKNSIFFTLGLSLIIAIILLSISFFTINKMENNKRSHYLTKKYKTLNQVIYQEYTRFGFTEELKDMINNMDLTLIESSKDIGDIIEKEDLNLLFKREYNNILLLILRNEYDHFLFFQTPYDEFLIIDKDIIFKKHNYVLLFAFLFLLGMIILLAYSVYKKLAPLSELTSKIDDIEKKDFKLDFFKKDSKDEVSILAQTLLEKSENLNTIKNARDVFIRNIMHELKTPITKGLFLTKLPDTKENKDKLNKVFYQLESLINEFAVIEEVIAKKENIEKKEIFFDDILENSLDILMLEDEKQVNVTHNSLKINVNFKLFTIVVKNLIDNALKYSKEPQVKIFVESESLTFSNKGEKLEYDLEKYYEPFFADKTNQKESFGLGLYIIKSILDVHNFKLTYIYENQENKFKITF